MDYIEMRRYAQAAERAFRREREAALAASRAAQKAAERQAAEEEAKTKAEAEAEAKAALVAEQVKNALRSAKEAGPEAVMFLFLVVPFNLARRGITGYDSAWYYIYQALSHEAVVSRRDFAILMKCANVRKALRISHLLSKVVVKEHSLTPQEYYQKVLHLHNIQGLLKRK